MKAHAPRRLPARCTWELFHRSADQSPTGIDIKHLMAGAGTISDTVRLPIAPPSDQSCKILDAICQDYAIRRKELGILEVC